MHIIRIYAGVNFFPVVDASNEINHSIHILHITYCTHSPHLAFFLHTLTCSSLSLSPLSMLRATEGTT